MAPLDKFWTVIELLQHRRAKSDTVMGQRVRNRTAFRYENRPSLRRFVFSSRKRVTMRRFHALSPRTVTMSVAPPCTSHVVTILSSQSLSEVSAPAPNKRDASVAGA